VIVFFSGLGRGRSREEVEVKEARWRRDQVVVENQATRARPAFDCRTRPRELGGAGNVGTVCTVVSVGPVGTVVSVGPVGVLCGVAARVSSTP